jgi:hypothetical protein
MIGLGWHPVDSLLRLSRGAGRRLQPARSVPAGRCPALWTPQARLLALAKAALTTCAMSPGCVEAVILARIAEGQVEGPDAAQDEERCATVGTRHLRRGGGSASRLCQGGAGVRGNHLAEGGGGDATGGVHKAEVSHLHEARRQDMVEEAAHKLKDVEAGGAWTGTPWFAGGEGDDAILQAHDAPVGDSDFADRGREGCDGGGAMGSGLAVDVPGDVPDVGIDLGKLSRGAHLLFEACAGDG